jgi:hypothetical protein
MPLLGPDGLEINFNAGQYKKAPQPITGEAFGSWAGRDSEYMRLPGGSAIAFDTSRLTISDFRMMRDHYQVASSLHVLTFMLHQLDWQISCDNKRVADHCQENIEAVWTRLVRAMSTSFWAGYSPNVLQWENDTNGKRVMLTKIKDLIPEECRVKWKTVDGPPRPSGIKPKFKVYDGIKQYATPTLNYSEDIPVENTFWYPLLMENGDYYGRRLLKSAFQPWFFSLLMHLFVNRYMERFGEPLPIARAPMGEEVSFGDGTLSADKYMEHVVTRFRNRGAVILPSDRSTQGGTGAAQYDYDIEFLESQMRGADFERYMTRLDEEISLALFTPLLLLRTADVGSYSLGVGHMQVYLWMLNALAGDWAEYINKYILSPMTDYNFGVNAPRPRIIFRKLGTVQQETLRAIVVELARNGSIKFDTTELGQAVGLTLEEVETVTAPTDGTPTDPRVDRQREGDPTVADSITQRVSAQVTRAYDRNSFDSTFVPDLGFGKALRMAFAKEDVRDPDAAASAYTQRVTTAIGDIATLGKNYFPDAASTNKIVENLIHQTFDELCHA